MYCDFDFCVNTKNYFFIIFNLNIFYFKVFCIFFRGKFLSTHLQSVFWREEMHHVFKLINNRLNNRDFNIDQSGCDYFFPLSSSSRMMALIFSS
jgi:hypothetical protein